MKKLMLASVVCAVSLCGFAATHTITDFANHASAKDALRVKTGDTITLPELGEGSYQAVNTRILQIDGNVATVLMPGIVGLQQLDGSGALVAVAAVLSVPDPIADGRVYLRYDPKTANWNAPGDWRDLTDSLEGVATSSYPQSTNDIAIIANYNGYGFELNVPVNIALGGLMVGAYRFDKGMENYKYWIRGPEGSVTNTLTFARSDGESPWIQLCPGANLVDQNLNFLGFGYNDQNKSFPIEVKCAGDVVCDLGWDGTDSASCHTRMVFGKDSTLTIPEGSSLTFENASPQHRGAYDSTIECVGAISGAGRFVNHARAAIKIDFDATDFTGTFVESSAARENYDRDAHIFTQNSDKFPNAGLELDGFVKMTPDGNGRPVYVANGGAGYFLSGSNHSWPSRMDIGNRLPAREVRSHGGVLHFQHEQCTWEVLPAIEYSTHLLALDTGFLYINISLPDNDSFPPIAFMAETCEHTYPATAIINCQKFHVRNGLNERGSVYCPWYAAQAVNGIVPWFAVQESNFYAYDNSGLLAFPVCDADGYLQAANIDPDDLGNFADGANAYVGNNKGMGISADKTVNSLVIENPNSNGSRCLGEGRKLTITSGGLILNSSCSRLGDWKWGTTADEIDPASGTVEFRDTAYVFANNREEARLNVIAAKMIAPKGFVAAHPGFLAIVGDQTGIDGEVVVNAGTLFLGCSINGKGNNSFADADVNLGCKIDVPVRIIGGGATLKINKPNEQTLDPHQNVYFEDIGGFAGKLVIPEGSVETCVKCYVDGVTLRRGTWGATGSGADYIDDDRFSGLGVLKVKRDNLVRPTQIFIF